MKLSLIKLKKRINIQSCIVLSFVLFFSIKTIQSQGVSIGEAFSQPHSSAILDLQSDERGFLLPRMTTTERNNINSPALSLMIFNTTTKCLEIYVETWHKLWCQEPDTIFACGNSFIDARDGSTYSTVQIGNQCWMAKNLAYLPSVVGPGTGSQTMPYYYVYGYDGTNVAAAKVTTNYDIYGVLYNWAAAMAGSLSSISNPSDVKGICPIGWHLPSDAEWTELIDYLGGANIAGGKLKATTHWNSPNTGANNETNFSSLPGGHRNTNGDFLLIENNGSWWSSTESTSTFAWHRFMSYSSSSVGRSGSSKEDAFSVRCVKD